ncbi:MAG: AsmA-like C-terminal region-containing protein [Bryobacteraceae bacterium]
MITADSRTRHRGLILGLCAGILAAGLAFYIAVPRLIRAYAADALGNEFQTDVRFQSLDVSGFPRFHITVKGVLIGNDPAHPLIQATEADAQSGWIPWHVRKLVLEGLSVQIPAAQMPTRAAVRAIPALSVDEVVAEQASVQISALHFQLVHLRVKNFDPSHAADFSVSVSNAESRADVEIRGKLGPWDARDPSLTPIDGTYAIGRSDLTKLPGLKGILSSQGRFEGVLQRARIAGNANVSGLGLSLSGSLERLHASFEARLDAADGSASIDSMTGSLQDSRFDAVGSVHNIQDDRLRDVALDLSIGQGRIEDVLPLAVKSKTSPIGGAFSMRAKLQIPPGEQDILDRLRLNGGFTTANARFSSLDLRDRLREVSRKGEGRPTDDAAGSTIAGIQGQLHLDHGVARFSNLVFTLEGVSAHLNGTYQLASQRLDLHGEALLDAKLSETATGPKALLLKVADPFFRRKQGGSRVPVKITGTRSDPRFAVDLVN